MKKKKYMVFLIISFLILIPLRYSEAQTNYFYYQGKKILMNLKNTEVTVIFSDNVTKTDAEKIISQSNLEGELHKLTNVGLKSFYLLKFNEQKSINKKSYLLDRINWFFKIFLRWFWRVIGRRISWNCFVVKRLFYWWRCLWRYFFYYGWRSR